MRRVSGIVFAFVGGLLVASPARATPQDLFGFGVRSQGMAMTGASFADDYEAVYSNPAGLSRAERRGLSVGLGASVYHVRIDGERHPLTPARGMTIGFQLPLPFGDFLEDRLVLGGGFYTPADVLLRGDVSFPEVPQFPVLDRAQVVAVQAGLGVDLEGVVDGLRVGVAISALADVVGDLFVRLNEENQFASEVETQLLATFSPIVGASWENETLGVSLTWHDEMRAVMELDIVTADLPVEVPPLMVGGLVQYDPHAFVLEGSYRPSDEWMVVLGATTRLWNAYPGAHQQTTTSSSFAPDPEYAPTVAPRIAVEHTHRDGRLAAQVRGGYAYEPTPAPPARMAPERDRNGDPEGDPIPFRTLDNDRHVVSAGLGISWRVGDTERITFDLHGQLHWLQPRTHVIARTDDAGDPMETTGVVLGGGWALGAEY